MLTPLLVLDPVVLFTVLVLLTGVVVLVFIELLLVLLPAGLLGDKLVLVVGFCSLLFTN